MVFEEIKKIIKEVILGDDSKLNKLKEMINKFFEDKDQDFFNNIDKEELNKIVLANEKLETLNEITRAYLDYTFNGDNPIKYSWRSIRTDYNFDRLRLARDLILRNADLDVKEEENVENWVDSMIEDDISWDDISLVNALEDLSIEISISNLDDNPKMDIFLIGSSKYKSFMADLEEELNSL
jgi:hypothetical protein